MDDGAELELALLSAGRAREALTLARCNDYSSRFGLSLTEAQFDELLKARREALRNSARVDIGGGALDKLVYAFCDSPYISRGDYFKTLLELQDVFYYFKTESRDGFTDDELIECMKAVFDGEAGGEADYLASLSPDELWRAVYGPRGEK